MTSIVDHAVSELDSMKKYPDPLYFRGDPALLKRPKVSMVGTRKPSPYTRQFTYDLAAALSRRGVVVVSGGAMGVDAIAHQGAGPSDTIAIMPSGLDIRYPSINASMLEQIEAQGLLLSQFPDGHRAANWSFVVRNELVVALGEVLIIAEAETDSGSMRSAEYALSMGKPIYVLPQPLDRSRGTNSLLAKGLAEAIYDVEAFADRFGVVPTHANMPRDAFFYFCQQGPTLDEAISRFGERVFEAELSGEIRIENGRIRLR